MRNKDVVNIKNGIRLGYVCDVEVDTASARLVAIVIYGRPKCFGLLGREEDIVIPWCDIVVIGEDTILVNCDCGGIHKECMRGGIFCKDWFN
jgi:YlmC/YmxH family sporulation protein